MKLVLSGDWHLDAVTAGVARREEIKRAVMDGPVRAAVEGRADLFCFMGDLCDPGSRYAVGDVAFPIEVARALGSVETGVAAIESVWIAGNHDAVLSDDAEPLTTLASLAAAKLPGVTVVTRRGWHERSGRPPLLLLPWEAYPREFSLLDDDLKGHVAIGHCTSFDAGAEWSSSEGSERAEYARGRDQQWPPGAERGIFAACGHFHEPGEVKLPGGAVHLVGSLVRLSFSDAERQRGFSMVEIGGA